MLHSDDVAPEDWAELRRRFGEEARYCEEMFGAAAATGARTSTRTRGRRPAGGDGRGHDRTRRSGASPPGHGPLRAERRPGRAGRPWPAEPAVNTFLADPALEPLWQAAAAALDRNGLGWRGRLTLPDLTPEGRRRLGVLVRPGCPVPRCRRGRGGAAHRHHLRRRSGDARARTRRPPGGCAGPARRHAATASSPGYRYSAHLGAAGWAIAWRAAAWIDGLFARHRSPRRSRGSGRCCRVPAPAERRPRHHALRAGPSPHRHRG